MLLLVKSSTDMEGRVSDSPARIAISACICSSSVPPTNLCCRLLVGAPRSTKQHPPLTNQITILLPDMSSWIDWLRGLFCGCSRLLYSLHATLGRGQKTVYCFV
jgi:hypothetical protein